MRSLFDFENYRQDLLNQYGNDMDSQNFNDINCIELNYSDDCLRQTVANTNYFILLVIKQFMDKANSFKSELSHIIPVFNRKYVCNNNKICDILISIKDDDSIYFVSLHLLKKFFGEKFSICLTDFSDYDNDAYNNDKPILNLSISSTMVEVIKTIDSYMMSSLQSSKYKTYTK